jgi:uncharacterized coiled-coil protein SlyX
MSAAFAVDIGPKAPAAASMQARHDLVREADKRRLKLSEEVERRLIHYEEWIAAQDEVVIEYSHDVDEEWMRTKMNNLTKEYVERVKKKLMKPK